MVKSFQMSQGFNAQGCTVGSQPQDCKRATSAEARREEERGPAIEKSKFLWVDTGIINRDLLNVHSYQVGFVSLPSPPVPLCCPHSWVSTPSARLFLPSVLSTLVMVQEEAKKRSKEPWPSWHRSLSWRSPALNSSPQ